MGVTLLDWLRANRVGSSIRCTINYAYYRNVNVHLTSRVAGTMVVHSSSVRVIACSNPSQLPPLLMHVGK